MKKFVKIAITIAAVAALTVQAFAATPKYFYKPVNLPKIPTITVPHIDVSKAVSDHIASNPIDVE